MTSLRLDSVSKSFGSVRAVADVSLEAEAGECVCLLGPPGAGKTTLLRVIAGLEKPEAGSISLGTTVLDRLRPGERDVAMVFDSLGLYPSLSVRENLAAPLRARKEASTTISERIAEMAALLRIESLLDRLPVQLSGGERQRVAIGRALIRRPALLLMDEPLSNLDALLRSELRAELKRLRRSIGATILYATHDDTEAMSLGDRVAVMAGGRILQLDEPQVLYEAPGSQSVARALGTPHINLVPGVIVSQGAGARFVHDLFEFDVPSRFGDGIAAVSRDVVLGIRPDSLTPVASGSPDALIPGVVHGIEPLGFESVVSVLVGGTVMAFVAPPGFAPEVGAELSLSMDLSQIHLFDAVTGTASVASIQHGSAGTSARSAATLASHAN